MRAGKDECVHRAGHADITEAPLFFELLRVIQSARVGKEALLQARKKDQRKFQAFGRVKRHQRDTSLRVELVGVGGQGSMVEELGQRLAARFGIVSGVGQFLEVLNAAESLRRPFGLQSFDVTGAIDEEADQLGERGGIARSPEAASAALFVFRDFLRVRF